MLLHVFMYLLVMSFSPGVLVFFPFSTIFIVDVMLFSAASFLHPPGSAWGAPLRSASTLLGMGTGISIISIIRIIISIDILVL